MHLLLTGPCCRIKNPGGITQKMASSKPTSTSRSLMDLPQEILQEIIYLAFDTWTSIHVLGLRGVNRYFHYEITKRFMRYRAATLRLDRFVEMPATLKAQLILHHLEDHSSCQEEKFAQHMQQVADDMMSIIQQFPTSDTAHLRSRRDVLLAISTATVKSRYDIKIFNYKQYHWKLLHCRWCTRGACYQHTHRPGCKRAYCEHTPKPHFRDQGITARDVRRSSCMIGVILDWREYVAALLDTDMFQYTEWGSICFGRPLATAIRLRCTKVMPLFLEREMRIEYAGRQYERWERWGIFPSRSCTLVLGDAARKGHTDVFTTMIPFATRKAYWGQPWYLFALVAATEKHWHIVALLLDCGLIPMRGAELCDNLKMEAKRIDNRYVLQKFEEADARPILLPI